MGGLVLVEYTLTGCIYLYFVLVLDSLG